MCLALLGAPAAVLAQTDEIQVYDAAIADQGVFNVMVHSNFTPSGRKNPDYPGGIIPNHSVNGAVEWAYGVTDWMEQGLYFPVYSAYSQGHDGTLNGFKIRELFVKPHADEQTFFCGLNFEFSVNYHYWESRHITSELRLIIWPASQAVGHHREPDSRYQLYRRSGGTGICSRHATRLQPE